MGIGGRISALLGNGHDPAQRHAPRPGQKFGLATRIRDRKITRLIDDGDLIEHTEGDAVQNIRPVRDRRIQNRADLIDRPHEHRHIVRGGISQHRLRRPRGGRIIIDRPQVEAGRLNVLFLDPGGLQLFDDGSQGGAVGIKRRLGGFAIHRDTQRNGRNIGHDIDEPFPRHRHGGRRLVCERRHGEGANKSEGNKKAHGYLRGCACTVMDQTRAASRSLALSLSIGRILL